MRRIRFATLLTLAALSAAPLLHAAAWSPTGWDGTLDLSGGSATVSVLIRTDANFAAQRSPIFEVNDRLHTDSGNTAFRMADADDANTNGNDIGIVRDNEVTKWANGSKTFPTEPDTTYLLSLVYVYDGTCLTVTAYVNGTPIYTGSSTREEQGNLTAQTFQTWPAISFYSIVSANGYAQALTAGQLAAMAGKGTSDLAAVTPLDVLQADLAALPAKGGTVTLAGNVDASGVGAPIVLDKPVTLVGGGYTLTAPAEGPLFQVKDDLTLNGVTIANENPAGHAIVVGDGTAALAEGAAGQTLTVTGAPGCAAIGGSHDTPACGDIVIDMTGTLKAVGGKNAAAIGSGIASEVQEPKGTITIQAGTVEASSQLRGYYGACIGGGRNVPVKSISITGGTVTAGKKEWVADAGDDRQIAGPVGIGVSACGNTNGRLVDTAISITGGTVTAYGSAYMAAIGGGFQVSVKSIEIAGTAEVTAVTAGGAAAIGGGAYGAGGQSITIGGSAKVIAEALLYRKLSEQAGGAATTSTAPGAAIGGGYAGKAGTIVIKDSAKVLATNAGVGSYAYWGGEYRSLGTYDASADALINSGAAIGAGRIPSFPNDMGSITIQDSAQVWAYGGRSGAGIGGGHNSWIDPEDPDQQLGATPNFPPISILGNAAVVAKGGMGASGIGGGRDAQVGSLITIAHTANVTAQAGATAKEPDYTTPAAIGLGSYNADYQYSPDQRPSTLAPATQPTTTLRVTGATAGEGGTLLLPIVTKKAEEGYVNLTDSPGLALQVEIGETLYAVSKTEGTAEHNKVPKEALVANPVSGDILDVAGSGALLLPLEATFYLADADGNVVARVDKVDDTTGTITKLDDALTLEPLSIYTKTGNPEKVTAADAAAILGVEDHATWVVTQAEGTLSSELAYVYDFGIAGLTIDKEQGTLTAVTVKMTEGVERAPRNVTLANATLTVYADGTAIATVPAPAFGKDGTLTVTLGEAYTPGATSTLSVSLSLKEASAP